MSSPATIRDLIRKADLIVGAALIPGARTPRLVTRHMLKTMKQGAVLVDVAIDQGGCFETSRETTHFDPTYTIDGVIHYAVSNMPGAVPRTSTIALTNATLPYALAIANKGWKKAVKENPELKGGAKSFTASPISIDVFVPEIILLPSLFFAILILHIQGAASRHGAGAATARSVLQ